MDDFLGKKRDSGTVLDLSKATATTKEEFRKLFDRVPDFKMKPERVRSEDIKVRDSVKKMKFRTSRKDFKAMREPFAFSDPIPVEMKGLKVSELAAVPIDWKMLSSVRPKSKLDEDFFSRIIELKKLEQKTEAKDKRDLARDPQVRKIKNKAGVVELRPLNCPECWEDFCTGNACKQCTYDAFTRIPLVPSKPADKTAALNFAAEKKKTKKGKKKEKRSRSPKKAKGKGKKRSKSKSPRKATK